MPVDQPCNEVRLRGRLSAPAEERVLDSGDTTAVFRLVVPRPVDRRGRAGHDTIACEVDTAALRRKVVRYEAGDVVEVSGSLRRRFLRGSPGASLHRVLVHSLVRTERAASRASMTG